MSSAFPRVCATALCIIGITATSAGAASGAAAGQPPRFCAAALTMREEFREAGGFVIRRKPDVRALRRVVSAAAEEAPRSLQPSFSTLLRFYDRILANEIAVAGDDEQAKDRYGGAAKRAGRSSLVVARYLRDRCGILL